MIDKSKITVRPARITELTTLHSFEQEIIRSERPFDDTIRPDPVTYYDLGALIESDEAEVMVAEFEHKIIATGYARIRPGKPEYKYERYAYLGFICVLPEYRGQGIVSMILDYLIAWSHSKNLWEIKLEVYDGNEVAVKAYEKMGFKKNIVEMRWVGDG
jgi:ribosomal protein S18 acetylase RimI-like enzyme